jgi:acetyl-CoA carboxylase carboxyltransferase component
MTDAQDWQGTLDDLERRRRHALAMGGAERVSKHRDTGKLDVRARIDRLLDKGSFHEIGTLVGGEVAADGIVVGSGLLNGTPVMVAPRTSPHWQARSGPVATPNATGSPNWLCGAEFRW